MRQIGARKSLLNNKKATQFMTRYIIIWTCIGFIAVTAILFFDARKASIQCIDGTYATDKSLCPQCSNDSQCGADKTCQENSCYPKACISDNDCSAKATCIFEKCTLSNGKVQN